MRITRLAQLGVLALALGCSDQPLDPIQDQPLLGASKGGEKQSLTGKIYVTGAAPEDGTVFITGRDDKPVLHMRNVPVFIELTGDIEAEGVFLQSSNFNIKDGLFTGNVTAPTTFTVTKFLGEDVEGTLEGRIAAGVFEAFVSPVYTLKGGGDLQGITLHMQHEGYLGGEFFTWTAWFKAL